METIKEIADRLGTHKTGIRRTLDALNLRERLIKGENGTLYLPDDVAEIVAKQYGIDEEQTETDRNEVKPVAEVVPEQENQVEQAPAPDDGRQAAVLQTMVDALTAQLERKDEQLERKDRQIESLQRTVEMLTANMGQMSEALSRAQALHAGTIAERLEGVPTDKKVASTEKNDPVESPVMDFGETLHDITPPYEKPQQEPQGEPWSIWRIFHPKKGKRAR